MNAKRFFYVAAGILLLLIAYTVGTHQAEAQGGGQFAGISSTLNGGFVAITSSGDVYMRPAFLGCSDGQATWMASNSHGCTNDPGWLYAGNVLGGTIATTPATMSGVKQNYKK